MLTDEGLKAWHDERWADLSDELRARIVARVRESLHVEDVPQIRSSIAAAPLTWWVEHHLWFGMAVRNALRRFGLTDEVVGGNLDDYWVRAVEEAVRS